MASEIPPSGFRLESRAVRVQRFGLPRATLMTIARIAASLAVAGGLTAIPSLAPRLEGPFIALMVLTMFAVAMSFVALLPLTAILVWKGLGTLLARTRPGQLEVENGELRIRRGSATWTFACTDVASVHAPEPGVVHILMEDGDMVRFAASDPDAASELTRAIVSGGGARPWMAPLHAAAKPAPGLRTTAIAVSAAFGCIALLFVPGAASMGCFIGAMGAVLWLTALRPSLPRTDLRLGADGIALRSDMGTRFISFARITRAEPAEHGVVLTLVGGEVIAVPVISPLLLGPKKRRSSALDLARLWRSRLLEKLDAERRAIDPIAGQERVARQGRSITAWRAAMRDLVRTDAPGYRQAVLPEEHAARIVESGHATPEARIGAALALAPSADPTLKRRLRIALGASVDESTRKAIVEALDDRLEPWRIDLIERRTRS